MQHHHGFIAVGGQGAAQGAGQHDSQHHLYAAHTVGLRGLNLTRVGLADGACQHFSGVAGCVQAEGQQRAEERFLEIGPRPYIIPALLYPLQLAQAVINHVNLYQQWCATNDIGVGPYQPAQRCPRAGKQQRKYQSQHRANTQ